MSTELVTIGQFSKLTGLTIKTLRFYHENELLEPALIDRSSGYRYYSLDQVDTARAIKVLRELDFPIREIVDVMGAAESGVELLALLQQRRASVKGEIQAGRNRLERLDQIIALERQSLSQFEASEFEVVEKELPSQMIASIRHQGNYAESSKLFPQIGRALGRHLSGKPFMLCWDTEFKENDADFEVAFPVKKRVSKKGIDVYELPGGQAHTLMHRGPYSEIHRSYKKLFSHLSRRSLESVLPSREVYHKGPGIIFKGNPRHYMTEIQVLFRLKPSQEFS